MPVKRTAIFGGSFDPPHLGHQDAVLRLLNMEDVNEVLVLPCFDHRFGKRMTDFKDRFAMTQAAFSVFSDVTVSDLELYIESNGSMLETVRHLRKSPHPELCLAIGADNHARRDEWDRFDELEKLVKRVIVLKRPEGSISSTRIRKMIRCGEDPSQFLHCAVMWYIKHRKLYTNTE